MKHQYVTNPQWDSAGIKMEPQEHTVQFLLQYSKALHVLKKKELMVEVLLN